MDCVGSRGFAICLRACDLIREPEEKEVKQPLASNGWRQLWLNKTRSRDLQ
jgi:hypothetical protein